MNQFFRRSSLTLLFLLVATGRIQAQDNAHAFDCNDNSLTCISDPCQPVCCEPCEDWLFSADLLYWRGLQNGLECGCGPDIDNRWNLGYRIGLENDYFCDCWDAAVYWTNFHSNSHKSRSNGDNAHWKLRYNTVDILFGQKFYRDSCFSYTPFAALRGAWIDEKLTANFGPCSCDDDVTTGITDQSHREKFWGVGPVVGIKADWDIAPCFSVYGGVGIGLLYGKFKIKVRDTETITDPTDIESLCLDRNFHTCQVVADIAIGVQWRLCFCNKIALVRLGLEHHRYFNHNQIGGYGDLCLDGVSLSVGINF